MKDKSDVPSTILLRHRHSTLSSGNPYSFNRKKRYSELRKECKVINERTLSLHLKELEEDGLITSTVHPNIPPVKVEYELTEFGITLLPFLKAIARWGTETAEQNKRIKVAE